MKVSVIGVGYVGMVTGVCLAELGNDVIFFDIDTAKLKAVERGEPEISEPGLKNLLIKNSDKISCTQTLSDALKGSDLTLICVGTPSYENGAANLEFVISACTEIGAIIKELNRFHSIVIKSTVIPGTTTDLLGPLIEGTSNKRIGLEFGLAVNPEFLREGNAIYDFFNPDRIVIGTDDERVRDNLLELYRPVQAPLVMTDSTTAEMIKYCSNAFLATKISFANEIGTICKKMNLDSHAVFDAVGLDKRINRSFFKSGLGFGGSCLPKDVRALIARAKELGVSCRILESVIRVNDDQPGYLLGLLEKHIPINGSTIGVLGLAFKPDTDDIRDSRSIPVIQEILSKGGNIVAFDPMAMPNFRKMFPRISYADSSDEVLTADAIVILTEWGEFENLDFRGKIVIDGRRVENARKNAAVYEGVCW